MPFVSKAQVRKFYELHKEGKMSLATIAHWSRGTKIKSLPEHKAKKKTA